MCFIGVSGWTKMVANQKAKGRPSGPPVTYYVEVRRDVGQSERRETEVLPDMGNVLADAMEGALS